MKCKECGSEIQSTDRFCGICGAPNISANDTAHLFDEQEAAVSNIDDIPKAADIDDTAEKSDSIPKTAEINDMSEETDKSKAAEPAESSEISEAPKAETAFKAAAAEASAPYPNPSPSLYNNRYVNNGAAAPFAYSQPKPVNGKKGKYEKEKKVVSLSVAILCIIAVFILAIICGVLMQMYINKGSESDKRSGMSSSSDKSMSCFVEQEQPAEYIFL